MLASLRSFKDLTVEDLRADPHLAKALRRLRSEMVAQGAASSAAPVQQRRMGSVITHADIQGIRSGLTPKLVANDATLRRQLAHLKQRATTLKTITDSHKFSAIGELGRLPPGAPRAAGLQTIASIGPGWVGPHRLMESNRRPTGPGRR